MEIINVIIENCAQIVAIILGALLAYAINYLRLFVAEKLKMQTLALAIDQLDGAVASTVEELQQVLVDDMKAAAADGKLTEDEIRMLGERVVKGSVAKLTDPAIELIKAAGIDITEYIRSVAETYVHQLKA